MSGLDDRLKLAWCGMHPERVAGLLEAWGSAAAVLRAIEKGQIRCSDHVRAAAAMPVAEMRSTLDGLGAELVTGEELPERIRLLPDAPDLLFVRGRLPGGPAIAVVGTRRCTAYGRRLARAYGRAIADAGWTLVSGLARGIDAAAHGGTVDRSGPGIAVLGSGLGVWYPPENRPLAERLLAAGGAIVTEYPPAARPDGWHFPARNRLISGLADAVVVVEAAVTGGALITANLALAHDRPVFAVPGDVDRETSRGCNLLIRDGAVPVLDPEDLVEALSLVVGPPAVPPTPGHDDGAELLVALRNGARSIETLAAAVGTSVAATLAEVGRLEARGALCVEHGVVTERTPPP